MASNRKVFAAGMNPDEDRIVISEYDGVEKKKDKYVENLNADKNLVMETSGDGRYIIVAYNKYESTDLGRVEVYHKDSASWVRKKLSRAESNESAYGKSLAISDDGNIILIATNSSVRVFDFVSNAWRPEISITSNVIDTSMTPDGNIVAISEDAPSKIHTYKWSNGNWNQYGDTISQSSQVDRLEIVDDGNMLFAASSEKFGLSGVIRVFDLKAGNINANINSTTSNTHTDETWEMRDNWVIRGTEKDDRLGRELSVSRDGKFVAWASNSKAGTLKWTGSKWQDEGVLIYSLEPKVALDPEGANLAVGLPNEKTENPPRAGMIYIYRWNAAPTVVPSASPSSYPSALPSSTPTSTPSSTPSTLPSAFPSNSPSFVPSFVPTSSPLPMTLVTATFDLVGKTAYIMSEDTKKLVFAFISDNDEHIAHFQAYDVPHSMIGFVSKENSETVQTEASETNLNQSSTITKKGNIVSIVANFEIIGVSLGLGDDGDTVAFGVFGTSDSNVCIFEFDSSAWSQLGSCVPGDQFV